MFSFAVLILKGLDTITHDEAVRKAFCVIIVIIFCGYKFVKSMLGSSNHWSQLEMDPYENE